MMQMVGHHINEQPVSTFEICKYQHLHASLHSCSHHVGVRPTLNKPPKP